MADDPADVAGAEVGLPGLAEKDVAHAGGQRHGVAAGVALHALGPPGRAAGIERVARVRGIDPGAGHLRGQVPLAQRRIVLVATRRALHQAQAAVDQQHLRRLVCRLAPSRS